LIHSYFLQAFSTQNATYGFWVRCGEFQGYAIFMRLLRHIFGCPLGFGWLLLPLFGILIIPTGKFIGLAPGPGTAMPFWVNPVEPGTSAGWLPPLALSSPGK